MWSAMATIKKKELRARGLGSVVLSGPGCLLMASEPPLRSLRRSSEIEAKLELNGKINSGHKDIAVTLFAMCPTCHEGNFGVGHQE